MTLLATVSDDRLARKSAQRLRWFIEAFYRQMERCQEETGNRYSADRHALAGVFAEWVKAFGAQKPANEEDYQDYVGFAAGLMLRSLVSRNPVTVLELPPDTDESNPAYFWPEGYLYVTFCLNVRGLVLEKDFHSGQRSGVALAETRAWWSFYENVSEDPSLSTAFLDLFAGDNPEWRMPELFRSGNAGGAAACIEADEQLGSSERSGGARSTGRSKE